MAGPAIRVEGAREVRRSLKKLGVSSRDMTQVHRKVAAIVIGPARARTRRKSGDLAASYRVRASAAKAAISSGLVYAPVQEWGWPRHGITPSLALTGAVEDERGAIVDTYRQLMGELVDRAERGA